MTAVAQEISDRGALTGFQMYTKTLLQQPMAREGTPRPGRAHRVPIYTRTLLQQPKAREDSSRGRADGRGRVVTGPLSKAATVDRSLLRCNPFFDCQYQLETAFVELTMAGAAVRLPTKSPRVGGREAKNGFSLRVGLRKRGRQRCLFVAFV